jgi:6-phosphogluconolactonase (cycloisomerase 2 family)
VLVSRELVVATCAGAFAQNVPEQATHAPIAPAALVYVSAKGGIYAFSAAANGKLTPVARSPFKGQLTGMAVNGKYLFGAGAGFVNIFSYTIAANGALKQVSSINASGTMRITCTRSATRRESYLCLPSPRQAPRRPSARLIT